MACVGLYGQHPAAACRGSACARRGARADAGLVVSTGRPWRPCRAQASSASALRQAHRRIPEHGTTGAAVHPGHMYLQNTLHRSPLQAGRALMPFSAWRSSPDQPVGQAACAAATAARCRPRASGHRRRDDCVIPLGPVLVGGSAVRGGRPGLAWAISVPDQHRHRRRPALARGASVGSSTPLPARIPQ